MWLQVCIHSLDEKILMRFSLLLLSYSLQYRLLFMCKPSDWLSTGKQTRQPGIRFRLQTVTFSACACRCWIKSGGSRAVGNKIIRHIAAQSDCRKRRARGLFFFFFSSTWWLLDIQFPYRNQLKLFVALEAVTPSCGEDSVLHIWTSYRLWEALKCILMVWDLLIASSSAELLLLARSVRKPGEDSCFLLCSDKKRFVKQKLLLRF